MQVLWGIGGMLVLLLIAFALSISPRSVRPRTVIGALLIQVLFAILVLQWPVGRQVLQAVADGVGKVINSANEGIEFMVGPILPEEGTLFAFQVLPLIVFVASLAAVLYHWNILQWIVRIIGGGLQKVLGTTRAESLNATANIFVGQTEAPLVIRPYLAKMTRSEFFAVMAGGLSTVAGTVLVGYSLLGARLEYLIAASFMAAPAGLLMAKIIVPETERTKSDRAVTSSAPLRSTEASADHADATARDSSENGSTPESASSNIDETAEDGKRSDQSPAEEGMTSEKPRNVIDAAATGASDGLKLALNVGAMLFAFISLIALLNLIIGGLGGLVGLEDLTFQKILGYIFSPVMVAIGVPFNEAIEAGSFLGQKLALNEFVAFADFGPVADEFTPKTATIITFALTGFANFSSLGILLGGLGGLVPDRRPMIAKYAIRAVLAGTLANLMSATIAGMLIG
ncbi:NupC/NupG family nucleoside CNT transporter [Haloactinomyces albus]|uniref:CNT family concentrative nucleoside transporter n=2 Tax=Haloactinomyces albus TaxID=1352928 RepID=A0AAE3ZAF3_9ACTN|nr:NupC/NupG family nucleoside CNT transporter [Haloactinomyces albus]MDR7300290.1 CNT family concentrative nucleoside transporter [Haloactinomyces albus]